MKLRELGEDRLLERLTRNLATNRAVVAGPGDDCALVRFPGSDQLLVLKTDCVVENVHFTAETKATDVGWKAMARPLSDMAAASARPQFALVTILAPATTDVARLTAIYRGLTRAAKRFEVAIVGGELSATDGPLSLSVTITGCVEDERRVGRGGGEAGDELFVTGHLGGSIRGKHVRFTPRLAEARWLTSRFNVHAMMDLSDGLGADLPRLARRSGVGFELDRTAIPRTRGCSIEQAISDGEDYELLFAIAPRDAPKLSRDWARKFPRLPLTRIGRLIEQGTKKTRRLGGYVHFA
ncbi:MAG: thiamine-phosphate kinase [Verrucomicrobiota bacterium]|nr:thiamine-phosphate kinase [Verrucomicrobiota bacterium]